MEDEKYRGWRAFRAPEFWLLMVAGVCALGGVTWWVVISTTFAGLSISSLPKYIELWPRACEAGVQREWWITVGQSALISLTAATGACVAGIVTHWLLW